MSDETPEVALTDILDMLEGKLATATREDAERKPLEFLDRPGPCLGDFEICFTPTPTGPIEPRGALTRHEERVLLSMARAWVDMRKAFIELFHVFLTSPDDRLTGKEAFRRWNELIQAHDDGVERVSTAIKRED